MISRVHGSILQGIDAIACEVEADVSAGGAGELKLVGLAEASVKESISRIQAALRNSGYRWPEPMVTSNRALPTSRRTRPGLTCPSLSPCASPAGSSPPRRSTTTRGWPSLRTAANGE